MDGENHLLPTNSDSAKLPRQPKELDMTGAVKYTPCTPLLSKEILRQLNLNMLPNTKWGTHEETSHGTF